MKITYINACLRGGESRTKRIADALLAQLGQSCDIDEIDLTSTPLRALDAEQYAKRQEGILDPIAVDYAHRVVDSDLLIMAFPFWDMSFPAIVKVFCEHITLNGITFKSAEDGSVSGCCRAKKLIIVTTRGLELEDGSPMEQGSSYLKAIGWLWGVNDVEVISAVGMDCVDEATREERILSAVERGKKLLRDICG